MNKKAKAERQRREMMRLQQVAAEQVAQVKQYLPTDDGAESERVKPVVGMPADIVIRLPGYGQRDATRQPQRNGWDRNGLIVRWHYPGLVLTLRRWAEEGQSLCYRVSEIEEVGGDDTSDGRS